MGSPLVHNPIWSLFTTVRKAFTLTSIAASSLRKYRSNRFGKECETPCWTAFYGGRSEYSPYMPVPSWFQPLIDRVVDHLGAGGSPPRFNAFLLRLYFDGRDEIAWHKDGRTFLGEEPVIASLSFGCGATFQMRRMNDVWPCPDGSKSTGGCVDTTTPVRSFVLNDGDLLVMRGRTQKHWHHRVPREKGRGVRLNINFRYVMPGPDAERGQRTYYKYMVYGDCPMDSSPPSWTFDEIMAKRGGMMKFIQRGVKRKAGQSSSKETDNDGQPPSVREEARGGDSLGKPVLDSSDNVASSTSRPPPDDRLPANVPPCQTKDEINSDFDSDSRQYLSSEQSVDREVFASLPEEIRRELVSEWRSRRSDRPAVIGPVAVTPGRALSEGKSVGAGSSSSTGRNVKKGFGKGTIHSFFSKKP